MKKLLDPKNLTREQLVHLVLRIQDVLYPDGDLELEWSADELEAVDRLLIEEP